MKSGPTGPRGPTGPEGLTAPQEPTEPTTPEGMAGPEPRTGQARPGDPTGPERLAGPAPEPLSWALLDLVGDEAVLPPGTRLTDESRPGRQCFVLLEGTATVEVAGNRLRELGPGAFVGVVGRDGRPQPLSGLTVQVATHARVLVIDARRLGALIDSNPAAANVWRQMSQQAYAAATAQPGTATGS